jgi:hypothetical protein
MYFYYQTAYSSFKTYITNITKPMAKPRQLWSRLVFRRKTKKPGSSRTIIISKRTVGLIEFSHR